MQDRKAEKKKQELLDYIVKNLKDCMLERYQSCKVEIRSTLKENNLRKTGVSLTEIIDGQRKTPIIYMDEILDKYMSSCGIRKFMDLGYMDYERICCMMGVEFEQAFEKLRTYGMANITDFQKVEKDIRLCICDPRRNTEMLRGLVYEIKGDFAQYYIIRRPENTSIKISNSLLHMWGISLTRLYKTALSNMKNEIKFSNCIEELNPRVDEPEEDNVSLYILTNKENDNGAAVIMNPEVQDMIAEKMKGDYYVMPISRHRLLVLPGSSAMSLAEITERLRWSNTYQTPERDFLSDHVQHYSAYAHILENAYWYELRVKEYPQKYGQEPEDPRKKGMCLARG